MPTEWTKTDYDTNYKFRVERYFGGHPNTRPEVVVHYHKWAMAPLLANRWAKLQPILNIQSSDFVLVVGASFGWGVDAIITETSATIVGVDISQYIIDEQANTEETELRVEIEAVGLDPDSGRGLELMGHIYDGEPRSNIIVLQENAATNGSRQNIRAALDGNNPTVCIAEDIINDDWTDTDIVNLRNVMNGFGGTQRLIFLYTETSTRTHQNLFDLLPGTKEVISPDARVYLNASN